MRCGVAAGLCVFAFTLCCDAGRTPVLLVLRHACRSKDAAAVFERVARNASAENQRVLGYQETCGNGWRANVTRAGLDTLAAKGAIGVSGWPGAGVCEAWRAAAAALGGGALQPVACSVGAARGAAVAALAARLAWRRVALVATEASPECAVALNEVTHALIAIGVTLHRAPTKDPTKLLIICASRVLGVSGAAIEAASDHLGPGLVLHVFDDGETEAGSVNFLEMLDERLPRGNLLLVSHEGDSDYNSHDVQWVVEEARRDLPHANDDAHILFHLYERNTQSGHWVPSGTIKGSGMRVPYTAVINITQDLPERWSTPALGSSTYDLSTMGALVTLVMLAAMLLTALAIRRDMLWRNHWQCAGAARRNGRRAVLLAVTDFSFPSDERRVDDGMESMLSCWLRRLQEFGGPETEPAPEPRTDLLAEPPLTQRASSLPSSTCSFNRVAHDARYQGERVRVRYLEGAGPIELKRKTVDALLTMQNLRHENLNPFIGWLTTRDALVWASCSRGTLEAVLKQDDITLDWTFRLSLLTDLVKGMRYLHSSPLRLHGRLSSSCCLVDARWALRVSDYGLPALSHAAPLPQPTPPARELLWTAPELLRDGVARVRGSQAGDVYSFAIVMQEVIVRGEPYCMLSLSPEELVEKLARPPPLIRPSVSIGAAPPEAVSVMRQCWSEAPELRPDFLQLYNTFRSLHRGRNINIVDSMFEMLEKYSNNLEELIKERTEQLDIEKKKTEQLLNRMLPRLVAERLLLGGRVEPEEFSSVSIYFSDIVGFTALAARSTPVQVVDLLNDLYSTFDAAIEQYHVYKVATMALHLLHLAGAFRVRHLPQTPLHLRIGLHSGPVCAAVVGLTMPRYCLFGDTVNTASRMESTGAAWRVQVSASTAALLAAEGGFRLRARGAVHIKGKGAMHTYWLLNKEGFDKPLPTPPPLKSEPLLETDTENDTEPSSASPTFPSTLADQAPLKGCLTSDVVSVDRSPSMRVAAAMTQGLEGCSGGVVRQWSLERGDELAAAAAQRPRARYRTRPIPAPRLSIQSELDIRRSLY